MSDKPRWEEAPFFLSYRLGELTLFSRRFRALVLREHFFDLPKDPGNPPPPLSRLGNDIDVIVTRSHPVSERLPRLTRVDGALRYVFANYARCYTTLSGDFEGYLAKFSAKTRSTLKRKVKRFHEMGPGSGMREYKQPQEMEGFYTLATRVSARTYQEKLLHFGLPKEAGYLGRLEALAKNNAVRAYLLFLREEPIAYLCCPALGNVLLYEHVGYDPTYAHLSPGTVLQYLVFESLFKEQLFGVFDFTQGQGEHKQFFKTDETLCADICYFPSSLSTRLSVGLHTALNDLSAQVGLTLERAGLKAAVKRFLRRR